MNKLILITLILFLTIDYSIAQVNTSSPYSRFGLGELDQKYLPEYNALGGGVTSLLNNKNINPYNPATYIAFRKKSFLFSTGGMHTTSNMKNSSDNQITNNTSFSHMTLGFKFNDKLAASCGLLPYSNTGYSYSSNILNNNVPAELIYSGDGGLANIYFGTAYLLNENISLGLNASYLFGSINRRKKIIFNDVSFLNSNSNIQDNIKGYFYTAGLIYKKNISDLEKISLGLTFSNNTDIRLKRNYLTETFEYSGTFEISKDTTLNNTEWGYIVLPQNISVGASYIKDEKLLLIIDYNKQYWSDYTLLGQQEYYLDISSFSMGVQYVPDYNSVKNYYKRVAYRFGFSYNELPIEINNIQLIESSVSFGFGLPVKKSLTKYDFSVILARKGSIENNLIREDYVKLGLSITYDGIWFLKRKYD
tara:strand:- start:843 stop:2102 length:1260 start_codon:yes stop_codon:yes gene_type:complete